MPPEAIDKHALRKTFLTRRQAISDEDAKHASEAACALFLHRVPLQPGQIIGLYHPIRGEISPMPLVIPLLDRGIRCTLPKVKGDRLVYHDFLPETPLVISTLGIAEPHGEGFLLPDIILLPLLAFDSAGHRLGYGGGFYDRLGADPAYRAAKRIGFAYDWQKIPFLPTESHDVRLHAVMTDQRHIEFSA